MRKKIFFVMVFCSGFSLGYFGMQIFEAKYFAKADVLSLRSENIIENPASDVPIFTPTETSSPTPTSTPAPNLTPKPTFTPTRTMQAPLNVPDDLEPLFNEFSNAYGVDESKLKKIADCESHFNVGVDAKPYAGLYQFTEAAWLKYRNLMGKDPNTSLRFGARESIETAAFVLSIGQDYIWPSCAR